MNHVRILEGPCLDNIDEPAVEYPFELDHFQKHANYRIHQGEHVLVTAHTGSGKTVIAEYGIMRAFQKGKKVIYTSPIKSLSNQKYHEFKTKYEERGVTVGILTGDIKYNPDAQCVIMTTEILRNMLFKSHEFLEDVDCVIFDEVHYINDPHRGYVWEESLVMLDPEITLVLLSATIDQPEEFADWLGEAKGVVVNLIPTTHRVVPLCHYYYSDVSSELVEIMSADGQFKTDQYNMVYRELLGRGLEPSKLNGFVRYLTEQELTPAIFFAFSRKGCERYAKAISVRMIDHEARAEAERIFNHHLHKYTEYHGLGQYQTVLGLIRKGVAYHHSGLIPVLKEIIEILFAKGLIKVLFATETFAVGVNMPAKTVVFTELSKFDGQVQGLRELRTDEYLQMSGRAGRRGLDDKGTVIHFMLRKPLGVLELRQMMTGKTVAIESKFKISYQFVLKGLSAEGCSVGGLIGSSLWQREKDAYVRGLRLQLDEVCAQMVGLDEKLEGANVLEEDLDEYRRIEERMSGQFSLKTKLRRKYQKRLDDIAKDNDIGLVKERDEVLRKKRVLEEDVRNGEESTDMYLGQVTSFLEESGYVQGGVLTLKGVMAAEVNECHEILLVEMVSRGFFNDLRAVEIVTLLGIFIDEKGEGINNIEDVNVPRNIQNVLYRVDKMLTQLIRSEDELGLDTQLDMAVYLEFVEAAYLWASGKTLQEIAEVFPIYEGNFIRDMLKLNNLCETVKNICGICQNTGVLQVLEGVEQLIIRDVVTVNSLYI